MHCNGDDCSQEAVPGSRFCATCQLKNEERKKQAQLERIATIEKVWRGETVKWNDLQPPKKYHGATWSTLSPAVQNQIMPFIAGDADLLTFIGCPGAGKTWAAWATVGVFLVNHTETTSTTITDTATTSSPTGTPLTKPRGTAACMVKKARANRRWLERLGCGRTAGHRRVRHCPPI